MSFLIECPEQLEFGLLQTSKELILLNIANASNSQRIYNIAEHFNYVVKVEIFSFAEWAHKLACFREWRVRVGGEDIVNQRVPKWVKLQGEAGEVDEFRNSAIYITVYMECIPLLPC